MTFLNPSALLFLLGIPVVVLFHLLKMRRREVTVSAAWLWGDSQRNQEASAPFRRLKPNLLLLLQILIVLALALALAHPVRTTLRGGYEQNLFILDVSAGMRATDAGGSRFEAARRAALEAIGRLGAGQQGMLIESGEEAQVLVAFTGDQSALMRAVRALRPRDVPGRLAEAFRLAQANLGAGGGPAVVEVFTDGAFDPPSLPDLGGAAIRWHRVGQRGRNVGITAFEARKTYFGTLDYQAFLSVANFGPETERFDLRLSLDDRPLKTERVTLGPDLRRSFVIPFAPKEGGLLKAELGVDDDLATDNQVLAVIPPPKPIRVLLISPSGNLFLEKALAADPLVQVQRGTPESLGPDGGYDVAILDSVPLRAPPPPGRYIFVNTVPPGVPMEVQGRVEQPAIMDWDRSHPAMRYLDLSRVVIQEALRLRPLGNSRTLVESNLTPLITAVDERGLKAILIGFDLTRSDFPLRVAFPLFLGNALRWLNPSRLEDAGLQLKTGQPVAVSLPGTARQATLTDPTGARQTLAADTNGRVTFMDTGQAGLYEIRAGSWHQRFALNLVNDGESNLQPRFQPADRAGAAGGERPPRFPSRTALWPYLAALALLLLLAEAAFSYRRSPGGWPLAAVGARLAVALAILVALAGPTLRRTTDQLNVLFLVDASDSVSLENRAQARQYLAEAVKAARPRDRYGVVTFGATPTLETPVGREPLAARPPLAADSRGTDIASAIRLGLAAFPHEGAKRVVLLSDGNENQGSAREAAQRARAEGATINVVPLKNNYQGEVLVEHLTVPAEVKFGESFLVRVAAWSASDTQGRLSLYRDGEFVGAQPVKLKAGRNVFAYQQEIHQGGFHVFQARLESPDDVIQENNRGIGVVAVRGRPNVLYVEKDRDQGVNLLRALRAQDLKVDMVGPEALPKSLEGLGKYDSLVLSNISALKMGRTQMELIRSYVRDHGGGLVMLGGEESFGVGGFYHTPVEEALPVTMEARQKVDVPSLAVALVIDRSGSMETSVDSKFSKLDLAKEAAQLVVEQLDDRSEVGVVAFDTSWDWIVPMQRAKDKDKIIQQIASIKAGGGTDLFPPLKDAYETIYDRPALLRHVLVLSDGEVTANDFPGLVRRMQKDKISVSSVAVGKDADIKFMTDISRWGRGRFYYTDDVYSIPRILTMETQLASKASIVEQAFRPVLVNGEHEIVRDIHWDQAPPLGGYVSTTPKPTADLLLMTHQRDPLLAAWRYGLGRSVAFTSDAKAKWAILWLRWPEFGKAFGQMVRWSLRTAEQREMVTSVASRGEQGEVQLEAVDERGDFINFLDAEAGIVAPDKQQSAVRLEQVGPGRYRARFEAKDQGAYLVGVAERKDQKLLGSEVASLVIPYSPEHRVLEPNQPLLRDLVTLTGGGTPAAPGDNFTRDRRAGEVRVDAWPYLLALALLLFLPDVALRRLWAARRGAARPTAADSPPSTASAPVTGRFGSRGRRS